MTRPALTFGIVACAIVGPALQPLAAQNREHQQMAAELRIVQEQQHEFTVALAQLAEALKAIAGRLDEQGSATRKALADQELSIKGLGADLNAIRERTQDTDTRIRTLGDEIEAQRTTLAALPALIVQSLPAVAPAPVDPFAAPTSSTDAEPVSTAPAPAPITSTAPTPSTVGLSPTRMFETARADYFAGQYALAISGFESLIRAFPRSESAGDAQFYIGETRFAETKWREAIAAYTTVIQNYKTSSRMPEALYKVGLAQEQIGQTDAARAAWEQAMKSYPDSDGARLSRQGLDRLSRRQP